MKLRAVGMGLVLSGVFATGCASTAPQAPPAAPVGSATITSGDAPFMLSDELEKSAIAALPPATIDTTDPWSAETTEHVVQTWGGEASTSR